MPIQLGPTGPEASLWCSGAQRHRFHDARLVWPVAPTSGIGTTSPQSSLDVNGSVRVGSDATCNASKSGAIQWTGTVFQGCNGSAWVSLTPSLSKQIFSANGTFTIPTGTTSSTVFKFTIVGGGGSGSSNVVNGGGGGAGGTAIKWLSGLTAGNTITVTVGPGGTGTTNSGSNISGNAGSASTIASGTQTISTVTANGGGAGLTSGLASGGTASGGDLNLSGGSGLKTVAAGSSFLSPGPLSQGNSVAGAYGAGGDSCNGTSGCTSGAGGSGIVIVEWVL